MTVSSLLRNLSSVIRERVEVFLNTRWYGKAGVLHLFLPFEWLYGAIAHWRKERAVFNQAARSKLEGVRLPTIVVGNIVVGGTGKTPVVAHVVESLLALGARPGIVTRGYGGTASCWPRLVTSTSDPLLCGDEAVELAQTTGCPVVAGPDRRAAIRWLQQYLGCNMAVSDDGLQHYAMPRNLEIVLTDAQRQFGNGHRLPVGPLREPAARLQKSNLIIVTARDASDAQAVTAQLRDKLAVESGAVEAELLPSVLSCVFEPISAQPLFGTHSVPIGSAPFAGEQCIALSGVGAPERFHADVSAIGCEVLPRALADHENYRGLVAEGTLEAWATEHWVVTTGKDAVKIRARLTELQESEVNLHAATPDASPDWHNRVWVIERRVLLSATDASVFAQTLSNFVDRWQLADVPGVSSTEQVLDAENKP